jgi:serine protease Do
MKVKKLTSAIAPKLLVIFFSIAATFGLSAGNSMSGTSISSSTADELKINSAGQSSLLDPDSGLAEGFTRIARRISPSVVNISTTAVIERKQIPEERIPEPLRRFFGDEFFDRQQGPQQRSSLGSGVIVDQEGYILTNYHVIAPTRETGIRETGLDIEVRLKDGKHFDAQVVGSDPESDLAVLKIGENGRTFPSADIGDSDALDIGDWVVAVGSPFGLDQTVTAGIVSADQRIVPTGIFGKYIQTDAAINPGNSGGPLVNTRGEVIGINTFITSTTGAFVGVGFAVPSTLFVDSYNQIIEHGTVERGWLGITMNSYPMTEELAEYFGVAGFDSEGIKDGDGAIVTQLIDEEGNPSNSGPAAVAGIKPGDVIVRFKNTEVESLWDLRSAVANTPPGESVPITVVRDGKTLELNVTLKKRSLEETRRADAEGYSFETEEKKQPKEVGLQFRTLRQQEAKRAGLDQDTGVVVLEVTPASAAMEAGLRPGQVITAVNGEEVNSAEEFKKMITDLPSGSAAILKVITVGQQGQTSIDYTSLVKP